MKEKRKEVLGFLILFFILFSLLYHLCHSESHHVEIPTIHRKTLSIIEQNLSNCTPPDIEQFPRPLMSYDVRRKGGLLVHVIVALYMFLALAVICDDYFVPSLEKICKYIKIQPDVAGATFMAAGSSAPELATAVIAVFVSKDDIGIGTVVGSAVFNIAFVVGICGLCAGKVVHLNCWPMFRDSAFYLISILALLFVLYDEIVYWYESLIFLVLYALYILFMFFNQRTENWIRSRLGKSSAHEVSYHPLPDLNQGSENISVQTSTENTNIEELSKEESKRGGVLWAVLLPINGVYALTVPDCRKEHLEKLFPFTFLCSCLWVGALSYFLVWMVTVIGFTLGIKDTIMGLTLLAAGASIPDAISSLIVVREGLGDMAISNAIGSNVFDILLCLGLPWFLQTSIVEPGSTITVRSRGLTYSTLTLLLTVIFLLVATHANKWKLDKKYGAVLLTWYFVFMVIAVFYESSLFGEGSAMCHSDF